MFTKIKLRDKIVEVDLSSKDEIDLGIDFRHAKIDNVDYSSNCGTISYHGITEEGDCDVLFEDFEIVE